ncbi:MAG: protein kinase, partial [Elusimicrobia bacterium]|nr:protein kinase [Elusimicrobiota bacterium]
FIDRALAANPNDPSLLHMRAAVYGKRRDWAKALADEKAALALSPKSGAMLRGKGYLELRGGQYKDALGSANAMIEANPNEAYGYALRAQAYARLGDMDAYRADIRRAAELDPFYQEAAAHPVAQAPSDSDLLFLFPGEEAARSGAPAAAGRARRFSWVVGASIVGGILLALGLLQTVLAPIKERVSSVFTRVTRTGPTVGALADEAAPRGSAPGLIRGQYEITRPIGAGGMGMVYEGTDRSLGRRVAIKKMRDELRVDPRERARFVSEAKTVAALHHPGIVDIYAIADDGDDVYLIFEYVDGKTVHDLIQEAGKLAPEQAARIVAAAAEALEFAHGRGVIHRDMKPSNMMVDAQGRVKVMDFGIARMAKEAMTRYSMTNTVVGTPPYMAPEAEQGQVRRESDVYALAVCAYEMLTGRLPFAGIGGGMSLNKINMSFVLPSRQEPGLPGAVDGVFARAFQADPEQRYRTPGEFAADLRAVLPAAARA